MPGTKLVQLVPFGGRKEIHIQQQAGKRCTFKVCPEREGVGGAIHWPLVFSISFCFLDPREAGNLAYTKGNLKTFFEIFQSRVARKMLLSFPVKMLRLCDSGTAGS